jgi:hypothetical protein
MGAIVLFVGIETPEGGRILGFRDSGVEDSKIGEGLVMSGGH